MASSILKKDGNYTMARNSLNGSTEDWKNRTHEVRFDTDHIQKIRAAVEQDKRSLHDVFGSLVLDNNALKVKSVEFYGSYTISYTLDKNHPVYPSHTWWFYDDDFARGIRVMSFFVNEMLEDWVGHDKVKTGLGLW